MFSAVRGTDQTAFTSASARASFSDPLAQRLSVRSPQSRTNARAPKHRLSLPTLIGRGLLAFVAMLLVIAT